jgi:GNAT superfamily N-acetyltransferase
MYELRDATAADREWLYVLHRSAMHEVVAQTWGEWDEAFQRRFFDEHFALEHRWVIVVGGDDAGMLEVMRESDRIFLENVELAPEFQSRGVGAAVIGDLLREAGGRRVPVELQVARVNPARRLYERLGFVAFGETETHHLMRALPDGDHPSNAGSQ